MHPFHIELAMKTLMAGVFCVGVALLMKIVVALTR